MLQISNIHSIWAIWSDIFTILISKFDLGRIWQLLAITFSLNTRFSSNFRSEKFICCHFCPRKVSLYCHATFIHCKKRPFGGQIRGSGMQISKPLAITLAIWVSNNSIRNGQARQSREINVSSRIFNLSKLPKLFHQRGKYQRHLYIQYKFIQFPLCCCGLWFNGSEIYF